MDLDIITLTGPALRDLLAELAYEPTTVHTLRVARDGDTVKYKINEDCWTAPYPLADEAARRLARTGRVT